MRRILVLLTAGLLVASLAAPAAASAGGFTVQVPKPNPGHHGDDTANIQKALDTCVAHGPGCTVQLQAGKYHTSQLVAYGFNGTFKGAGENRTTIEALKKLSVGWPETGPICAPNTRTCLWPMLIMFVKGNIEVSDLTISEPWTGTDEVTPTAAWPNTFLYDLLAFTGQSRTNASLDRVRITGVQDHSTTSFVYGYESPPGLAGQPPDVVAAYCAHSPTTPCWGWNLVNGVDYSPFNTNGSADFWGVPLTGSFSVRNSTISWAVNPIALDGPHASDQVTIGGAPGAGNYLSNAIGDLDLESTQRSTFDISYNTMAVTNTGMWVSWDPTVPTSPSQYLIHDNLFEPQWGCGCAGVELYDNPVTPYIQAKIWHNTVKAAQDNDGFWIEATKGVLIAGNTMTAAGLGGDQGIALVGATHTAVIANNVSGFGIDTTSPYAAQIWLSPANLFTYYGGPLPAATDNLVVCLRHTDQVLDQGFDNMLIGCDPPAVTPKAAVGTPSPASRLRLTAKPFLP